MKENSNDDKSIKSTKINNKKMTGQINESYESSKQDVVHIYLNPRLLENSPKLS